MNSAWTLDFETLPIGPRPEHYPPKPVGLAWRDPYGETGYETDWQEMRKVQGQVLKNICLGARVEFHNAKFDMHVAAAHFDIRFQDHIDAVDDTMIMGFLVDPYARTLGLKPLADKWLGWAADEKDACVEWILANKDRLPTFPWITDKNGKPRRPSPNIAGAWLAWVPEEILGPYAIGDIERTHGLAQVWRPIIERLGMADAYRREMRVMPIFMQNEEDGMRCDVDRLARDLPMYRQAFEYAEQWLRWRLGAQGLNFDADADVADILDRAGVFTDWVKTKSGQRSTSKDNMHINKFHDRQVGLVLGYRNRMKTAMKMFMEPWLEMAQATGGRIHTDWNQVQGDQGGTKTGRPSTRNPNFLNISKNFEGRPDGYEHPAFLEGLPHLPLVRKYILPDEGHVLLKRDFSGQELHVFGHFEHGDLQRKYAENHLLDVHHYVGENFNAITGQTHWTEGDSRTALKAMNFQGLYGGGVPALANAIGISIEKARELKDFHERALPGRKTLADTLTMIVSRGQTIRTWGGRLYSRPPYMKGDDGRMRPADYRLINYLVQGSSADITKTAMLNLTSDPGYNAKFMLQVYDEMNISAPIEEAYEQMMILREAMESIPLRTKLPTDGEFGWNWGEMKKLKKPEDYEQLKGLKP